VKLRPPAGRLQTREDSMSSRTSFTPAVVRSAFPASAVRPLFRTPQRATRIACLLCVVLASGCGWKSWQYDDGVYKVDGYCDPKRTYPPRPSDHEILVLSESPREAHEVVARIWVAWNPGPGNETIEDVLFAEALRATIGIDLRTRYGSAGTALSGIKDQARAVGADAIVTVRGTFSSPSCVLYDTDERGVSDIESCELRGVVVEAIRFEAERPGTQAVGGPEASVVVDSGPAGTRPDPDGT